MQSTDHESNQHGQLPVWGTTMYVGEAPPKPDGSRRARCIVAAESKIEAARLLGCSVYYLRANGPMTGNAEENAIANGCPGVVFWRHDGPTAKERWVRRGSKAAIVPTGTGTKTTGTTSIGPNGAYAFVYESGDICQHCLDLGGFADPLYAFYNHRASFAMGDLSSLAFLPDSDGVHEPEFEQRMLMTLDAMIPGRPTFRD